MIVKKSILIIFLSYSFIFGVEKNDIEKMEIEETVETPEDMDKDNILPGEKTNSIEISLDHLKRKPIDDENIENILDQLSEEFNVSKAYLAAELGTQGKKAALDWLLKQIPSGSMSQIPVFVVHNSQNDYERDMLYQAIAQIHPYDK